MVAGYQKNNQPKHGDVFFSQKKIIGKSQGKDMETIQIKWKPCISMYPPIFGQKSLKVQTRHVFFSC